MTVCCFFNDTATTEIYTLSLHDALPISIGPSRGTPRRTRASRPARGRPRGSPSIPAGRGSRLFGGGGLARRIRQASARSEEHTSELQSRQYLVCRLLLEKKTHQTVTYHL